MQPHPQVEPSRLLKKNYEDEHPLLFLYCTFLGVHITMMFSVLLLIIGLRAALGSQLPESLQGKEVEGKFLFAKGVTTHTVVTLSTKTIIRQCIQSVAEATRCGKKRRRRKRWLNKPDVQGEDSELAQINVDGSLASEDQAKEKAEKFGFRVWTSSRVTSTGTVKTTATDSTLSWIVACTVGNLELPSSLSCPVGG